MFNDDGRYVKASDFWQKKLVIEKSTYRAQNLRHEQGHEAIGRWPSFFVDAIEELKSRLHSLSDTHLDISLEREPGDLSRWLGCHL